MKEFLFQSGSILIQRERDIVLLSKSSSLHILDKVKLNLFPIIITLKSESKYKSQGGGGLTTKIHVSLCPNIQCQYYVYVESNESQQQLCIVR